MCPTESKRRPTDKKLQWVKKYPTNSDGRRKNYRSRGDRNQRYGTINYGGRGPRAVVSFLSSNEFKLYNFFRKFLINYSATGGEKIPPGGGGGEAPDSIEHF